MLNKTTNAILKKFERRIVILLLILAWAIGWIQPLSANGLFENRPWQFSRKARVKLLELQELKDSGFYDAHKSAMRGAGQNGASGGTTINGHQINCMVQSLATGNVTENAADAVTGSLNGVTSTDVSSEAAANRSDNDGHGDSGARSEQDNTGNVDSSIGTTDIKSDVGSFQGGGASNLDLESAQSMTDSPMTATNTNSQACDSIFLN